MTTPTPPSDPRPRVLVLTSTYPRWPGDPEPGFVHELCKRLTARFQVHVLGPHAPGAAAEEMLDGVAVTRYCYAPAALETLVNDGGIVTNLRRRRWKWLLLPGFVLAQLWATRRMLRRYQPDVVHAHWLLPQGWVMAVLLRGAGGPPFVVTSHGADLFALRGAPFRALKRAVIQRAAALTVVSEAMVEPLCRLGADRQRVSVQPMGVDLQDRFTPDPAGQRRTHELLFVGRLVEKKGLRHLIEALPAIALEHPEVTLTVAGFGPEMPALQKQVRTLGLGERVNFLGAVTQAELPALYRRAALFVAPFVEARGGDQEGLGLVTVEAIGCGCPALVSDLPATRALPVLRVASADPAALASAIGGFLHLDADQRQCLAAEQRQGLHAYDWSAVASAYAQTLMAASRSGNRSEGIE